MKHLFFSIFYFFKSTEFYLSSIYDCVLKKTFGARCSADNQCESNLACDIQPVGAQSKTCLFLNATRCAVNADCVNNLGCLSGGYCGCLNVSCLRF